MRDDGTAALNRGSITETLKTMQHGTGDQLVTPARGNNVREASAHTRVRELHWRRGQRGEHSVRTENHDRYSLRHRRLGRGVGGHSEGQEALPLRRRRKHRHGARRAECESTEGIGKTYKCEK